MIIGITISFAGNPKINASKITPSSPISEPRGWRKFEIITHRDSPFIIMFDINHITIPAGAATHIALKSTKMVLSSKERTIVYKFEVCGMAEVQAWMMKASLLEVLPREALRLRVWLPLQKLLPSIISPPKQANEW